jgi:hypothetical protein
MRNQQDNNYLYEQMPQQSYGPPLSMPSERADLLDKIRPSRVVDEIFHRLLGEEEINGVWVAHPALKEKALSFIGAWNIATLMLPVSSQNVSLSKLKDHEIRARALSIARTAQKMCLRNWKEYGIRGTDQLYFVHEIIFSNTFITLKQPQEEGIRKLLSNTMTGEVMPPEQTQAGGMMQSLFRR